MASTIKPQPLPKNLKQFSTVLSDGREVVLRQALVQDLVYIQSVHGNKTESEQSAYLVVKLSQGKEPLSLQDVMLLTLPDFNKISELVAKCTGVEEGEDSAPLE